MLGQQLACGRQAPHAPLPCPCSKLLPPFAASPLQASRHAPQRHMNEGTHIHKAHMGVGWVHPEFATQQAARRAHLAQACVASATPDAVQGHEQAPLRERQRMRCAEHVHSAGRLWVCAPACVCVCQSASVCARTRVCPCVSVRECVRTCVCLCQYASVCVYVCQSDELGVTPRPCTPHARLHTRKGAYMRAYTQIHTRRYAPACLLTCQLLLLLFQGEAQALQLLVPLVEEHLQVGGLGSGSLCASAHKRVHACASL